MDKFELFKIGEDIVKELNVNPSSKKLKELFKVRTAHWKYPMQYKDACATIGTFDDLEIRDSDAFDLIPSAVDICLEQTDEDLIITSLRHSVLFKTRR